MGFIWATETQGEDLRARESPDTSHPSLFLYYDGHALDGGSSLSLSPGSSRKVPSSSEMIMQLESWGVMTVNSLIFPDRDAQVVGFSMVNGADTYLTKSTLLLPTPPHPSQITENI